VIPVFPLGENLIIIHLFLLIHIAKFNPSFNLNKMMKIEQEIIDTMVSRADCFLAKTSDAREYFHLIAGLQ
jgi:hypothetical protein